MHIYIIIILFIITLFLYYYSQKEHFNPIGHEENLPDEYRFVNFESLKYPINQKEFRGRVWELRFPSLVNQRYSYNDTRNPCRRYTDLNEFARLKELPIGFDPYFHEIKPQTCRPNRKLKEVSGFDYNNAHRVAFNAGPGTSDSFYLEDKGY